MGEFILSHQKNKSNNYILYQDCEPWMNLYQNTKADKGEIRAEFVFGFPLPGKN
jgi:hypothetical protein